MRPLRICVAVVIVMLITGTVVPAEAAEFLVRMGHLQIPQGAVVQGDAIAVGGGLNVDGTVEGNAVAIGGDVRVSGKVTGSVRAIGGNALVYATAVVGGTATAWGGKLRVAPGGIVGGNQPPSPPPPGPHIFPLSQLWWVWWVWPAALAAIAALKVLYWLIAFVFLAGFIGSIWLTAVLFPGVITSLASGLERAPLAAFGVGLLAWAFLVPLVVFLAISLVGLTLVFLIPVTVFVMVQFGMTAIALFVGRRIHRSGIGLETFIGACVLAVVFALPHLGWFVLFAVATWALGAVVLSVVERGRGRPLFPPTPPVPAQDA
jgi:hypothetical protein